MKCRIIKNRMEEEHFRFAVVFTKFFGKYVLCKHKERDTLEFPGGRREAGETIMETAKRELREETGAIDFKIEPLFAYSVLSEELFGGVESFGMLFLAEVTEFEKELHSEIERIIITDRLPDNWTYPEIQENLLAELQKRKIIER